MCQQQRSPRLPLERWSWVFFAKLARFLSGHVPICPFCHPQADTSVTSRRRSRHTKKVKPRHPELKLPCGFRCSVRGLNPPLPALKTPVFSEHLKAPKTEKHRTTDEEHRYYLLGLVEEEVSVAKSYCNGGKGCQGANNSAKASVLGCLGGLLCIKLASGFHTNYTTSRCQMVCKYLIYLW